MEDQKKEKKTKEQEFIVETPIEIEEKINGSDKVIKYERGKFLGKGGFAKCYEMKRVDTGKFFAAKAFEKKALNNAKSRKKLINEIKLHKNLHHQNTVNLNIFLKIKKMYTSY
jgi:polo-like kinase 1